MCGPDGGRFDWACYEAAFSTLVRLHGHDARNTFTCTARVPVDARDRAAVELSPERSRDGGLIGRTTDTETPRWRHETWAGSIGSV